MYAVTLGVEGSASMPSVIEFPLKLVQSDLKGGLSIKASVLGFKYSKEMLNGTYPLYKAEDVKTELDSIRKVVESDDGYDEMNIYDESCYVLPDKVESEAKWCGNQTIRLKNASSINSNLKEKLLIEGASELSEPMLVQDGEITIAVFLTEDSSRDMIHRTKLVYMVYDNAAGEWSSPVEVDDDGTGDFYPYLTASNGRVAVSWLNFADTITNAAEMEQALQSSEICYAVWNKDTGSFEKASEVLISSPAASYNNARIYLDAEGNVTEVGLKNTACNIFGVSGDNILFMTGTCNGTSIEREFTLSQGLPVSYDVSALGGNVTAAVCADMDKDLNTLDDREIYLYSSDGSTKRLTENNTYDAMPQYAEYQGNETLFWYAVDGIRILENSGQQDIINGGDDVQISENFAVINGENGEAAIIWSDADENQTYQLAGCLYDAQTGKWTRQIFLSDSNEDIFRPDGFFDADGDMEFLYRKGSTAEPGKICSLQVAKAPDLEVVNAYIEDGTEVSGENTKVFVGVRNLGTRTVTECSIDVEGQTTVKSVNILPGESALLETEYRVPDIVEKREVTVQTLVPDDSDTSNNSLTVVICGFAMDAYADGTAWDIENTLDVSEVRQGDTVTMSVNLKGSGASSAQEIAFMEGTLEYDSSLFTVEKADILPTEDGKAQSCLFDPSTGIFSVQYSSGIAVQDGGQMLQIRLHTAADASVGKTTLCVTHMKWTDAAGQQAAEIEHRVPARITIAEAETLAAAGDVNQDGKVNLTDAKLVMQHYNGAGLYVLEQSEGSRYTKLSKYDLNNLEKTSVPVFKYGGSSI